MPIFYHNLYPKVETSGYVLNVMQINSKIKKFQIPKLMSNWNLEFFFGIYISSPGSKGSNSLSGNVTKLEGLYMGVMYGKAHDLDEV